MTNTNARLTTATTATPANIDSMVEVEGVCLEGDVYLVAGNLWEDQVIRASATHPATATNVRQVMANVRAGLIDRAAHRVSLLDGDVTPIA